MYPKITKVVLKNINFVNCRRDLSNFDKNLAKIGDLIPGGVTISNPTIEFRWKKARIPRLALRTAELRLKILSQKHQI